MSFSKKNIHLPIELSINPSYKKSKQMKKILKYVAYIIAIVLVYFGYTTYPKLDLISGFSAKSIASAHFIDQRPQQLIETTDNDIPLISLAKNQINDLQKWASASVFGLKERKAIYREGLGATLINDTYDPDAKVYVPKRQRLASNIPFPYGNGKPKDSIFETIDYQKLEQAVTEAFDLEGQKFKRTRSVLVLYKDHLIAEKYTQGFNQQSKILGWSMTKSLTATYFGILEHQGKFDIKKPAPIAAWQTDERKNITTNDLLHMNSGLEWDENYNEISDATKMLFLASDMGQVQLEKKAIFKPNTHWNYSSGTTNLLSKILRNQFPTQQAYLDFWYQELIDKIGMHSMIVETDMSGQFVGSSYGWATTRDWSKLGLLYLHQGKWNGETIFDPSWAKYVATPTANSNQNYGAHFWLNAGKRFPDVPSDMYYCSGFQGQMVAIIPSYDLVIVRMGLQENPKFDFNQLISRIVKSIQK